MNKTIQALLAVLLMAGPVYAQSEMPVYAIPNYDQPQSRMTTEPIPRNTDPYLVPANRNPYFDDPSTHVEGVPTGNPETPGAGVANPSNPTATPVSAPINDSDSGYTGGIGHNGTEGIRGSGD